eukprot:CAMPEP_0198519350 /NCGR_PEP_ID=MMETSP1462-20131121/19668_1 /TAXON_ID=1333877 /ORGANISM="Brandtodinium nutriculum, Strain RCC3387" /LENGTH=148 /DNA_ID=CAMNT_0044248963 /DNA_START=90 /DNA_END=533 /DNA_ORIENTATION=+
MGPSVRTNNHGLELRVIQVSIAVLVERRQHGSEAFDVLVLAALHRDEQVARADLAALLHVEEGERLREALLLAEDIRREHGGDQQRVVHCAVLRPVDGGDELSQLHRGHARLGARRAGAARAHRRAGEAAEGVAQALPDVQPSEGAAQ